jgi:nitrate/TMAO reductase-like tetraheme cytochrome c subunit
VCLRCHEANPSRPKWHKQIVSKDHYTGSKCTECHVPHSPLEVP